MTFHNNKGWSTNNELNYITKYVKTKNTLKNYIKSAKQRIANDTFGTVKGKEVIKLAKELLKK